MAKMVFTKDLAHGWPAVNAQEHFIGVTDCITV